DGCKPGDRYKSEDEAAVAAMKDIYKAMMDEPVNERTEVGSKVYKNKDESYTYSDFVYPESGNRSTLSPEDWRKQQPGSGQTTEGLAHTHPNSPYFSDGDYFGNRDLNVYLVDRGGDMSVVDKGRPGPPSDPDQAKKEKWKLNWIERPIGKGGFFKAWMRDLGNAK